MLSQLFVNPLFFFVWLVSLAVAVTIHEFSHAWTADRLGDPTPRAAGRLSLNPLSHLDPLGTLMLIISRFGWGKPVPIDPFNLKNPKRDNALISLAGPLSNLLLAGILAVILKLQPVGILFSLLVPLITMNVALAIFNLLPIPPLDGAKILLGILSNRQAAEWSELLEQYSPILLILIIMPFGGASFASRLITPIINSLLSWLIPILQVI